MPTFVINLNNSPRVLLILSQKIWKATLEEDKHGQLIPPIPLFYYIIGFVSHKQDRFCNKYQMSRVFFS